MRKRFSWPAVLCAPALLSMMGATDCEYFDPVKIPANDSTKPTVGTRLLAGSDDDVHFGSPHVETDDLDAAFLPIPFAIDAGGVRQLQMASEVFVACREKFSGDPATGAFIHFGLQSDTQAGDAGDTVSNGIYLVGTSVQFEDYADICDKPGIEVDFAEYSWNFAAVDFDGNQRTAHGSVLYQERGTCACEPSGLGGLCLPNQQSNDCTEGYVPHCEGPQGCGGCSCE